MPQQLLRQRGLPREQGGEGGPEAALEQHSTNSGMVLSLYMFCTLSDCFVLEKVWTGGGESATLAWPQASALAGPASTIPVDTQGVVTQDLGGNREASLLKLVTQRVRRALSPEGEGSSASSQGGRRKAE